MRILEDKILKVHIIIYDSRADTNQGELSVRVYVIDLLCRQALIAYGLNLLQAEHLRDPTISICLLPIAQRKTDTLNTYTCCPDVDSFKDNEVSTFFVRTQPRVIVFSTVENSIV